MIQGDVLIFLQALKHRETDREFGDVVSLVGSDTFERERFHNRPEDENQEYLKLPQSGLSVLLEFEHVRQFFIYATPRRKNSAYAKLDSLVDGVSADMDQVAVTAVLGEPLRVTSIGMTYDTGSGFVQFEFKNGKLDLIVVLSQLISFIPTATPAPMEVAPLPLLAGDMVTIISAIGTGKTSPEHLRLIVLGGARMEIEEEERSGIPWESHYFGRSGMMLQFRDSVLVGALVCLVANESGGMAAYPRPNNLIDGFPPPWTRAQVLERVGTPERSSLYMELFLINDRYVRFEFDDDVCTEISFALPGVSND